MAVQHLRHAEQKIRDVLRLIAALVGVVAESEHRRERHGTTADGADRIVGKRQAERQRRVAVIEIARETCVDARMRVVVFVRETGADGQQREPRQRHLPVRAQRRALVEERRIERLLARANDVLRVSRRARERLHRARRHGSARRRARQGVDRQREVEELLLAQFLARTGVQARVLHAPIRLAVDQQRRVDFPRHELLGDDFLRNRLPEQRARRRRERRTDLPEARRLAFLQLHPQPPPPKPCPPLDASLLK